MQLAAIATHWLQAGKADLRVRQRVLPHRAVQAPVQASVFGPLRSELDYHESVAGTRRSQVGRGGGRVLSGSSAALTDLQ
jgi:hypothetical protein